MLAASDAVNTALILAGSSVIVGLLTFGGVVIASKRAKTAKDAAQSTVDQIAENNGWAKTNTSTLEALFGELHEFRGELRQWRRDHETNHASKRRNTK